MSNSNDGGEFLKGLLFGGIVGALAGLLYAPKSGRETREELWQKSLELRDDAEGKLELAQRRAETLLAETRKQIEELQKEAEAALAELKTSASEKTTEGKETISKERERLKDAVGAGVAAYKQEKADKSRKSS